MELEIYLRETAVIAQHNQALLDEVSQRLLAGETLSKLEESGMLHALQVLIENAIGKAKHCLKQDGVVVPVSAYDVFALLVEQGHLLQTELKAWQAIVGLRNKIVHDYMNIDVRLVSRLVQERQYQIVAAFLLEPFSSIPQNN